MSQKELEKRLMNVIMHLNSDNLQSQAAALTTLRELLDKQRVPLEFELQIIEFIKTELNDPRSPIRTDCFEIATLLGKLKFGLVDDIFLQLFQELSIKNRFRTKIIMDFIKSYVNSSNSIIQDAIKSILLNGHKWFNENYLIPIFLEFLIDSTQYGYNFIEKYQNELELAIQNYPPEFIEVNELIQMKLNEFNAFQKEIQLKKLEKERIIQKNREKRQLERKKRMDKIINGRKRKTKQNPTEKEGLNDPRMIEIRKKKINFDDIKDPEKMITINEGEINNNRDSIEEPSPFVSFSSLGLKRKKLED